MAEKRSSSFLNFLDNIFDNGNRIEDPRVTSEVNPNHENSRLQNFTKFLEDAFQSKNTRKAKYVDYDVLDEEPLPSRSLDIIASLVTQGEIEEGEESSTYSVVTKNNKQMEVFEAMEIRTDIKGDLFSKVRTCAKYGINPQEVIFAANQGIHRFKYIPAETFMFEDPTGEIQGYEFPYKQVDAHGSEIAKFKDFQVACFRFDNDESRIYGKSILQTIRKTAKIIDVLENSLAFRDLSRSVQRWLWLIDSTGLSKDESWNYVNRIMKRHMKPRYIDYQGKLNLSRLPVSDMSDIALPVYKDGAQVDIKGLPTDNTSMSREVLNHFMSKFFGGVGIPNYYFSFEGARQIRSVSALTYTDILLARLVYRFQTAISRVMWDVYNHESQFHGIEDTDFKLVFPVMGTVDEMMRYQILNLKVQIANTLRTQLRMVDDDWIFNFLKFANQDMDRLKSFRDLVQAQEKKMMTAAANGVFIQPVSTWGKEGDDPFDLFEPAPAGGKGAGATATGTPQQGAGTQTTATPAPDAAAGGESILPNHRELYDAMHRSPVESAQLQLIQQRMQSETVLQQLLQDIKIKSMVENINDLANFKLQQDDPFNTGILPKS